MAGLGGRLTLLQAQPIMKADAIGKVQLFYAPHNHGSVPVLSGGVWTEAQFSTGSDDIGWSLTPTLASNTSYHISTLGSGLILKPWGTTKARDSGRQIFTDDQSTWLGSIRSGSDNKLTQHVTPGEYRTGAVWNLYNQECTRLIAGTTNIASYAQTSTSAGWSPIAAGYEARPFTGTATAVSVDLRQSANTLAYPNNGTAWAQFAVGWNSTSIPLGFWGSSGLDFGVAASGNGCGPGATSAAMFHVPDAVDMNTAYALHSPYVLNSSLVTAWSGTRSRYMVIEYRG